jgi:hypothetical protein
MLLTLNSSNAKLGGAATTYAPIVNSCPTSCPFMGSGCYGQNGPVAIHGSRLESQLRGLSADTVAMLEAAEIRDGAAMLAKRRQTMPLRLHTFGDCRTTFAASTVASAAKSWPGAVWTYTHAWRDVPRGAWGSVSVLASCEGAEDAREALAVGYAAAIVVEEHPADGRAWTAGDIRVVPCPEQMRGRTCAECRLCWDADRLLATRSVIAFAAHGAGAKRAKRKLRVVK